MGTDSGATRAIVTVHGTWAGDRDLETPRWWEKNSAFCGNLASAMQHERNPVDFHEFMWSGENSFLNREAATKALIDFLEPLSKAYNTIDLIAHSHGGNIVANALYDNRKNSREVLARVQNVVSVGTPFFGRRTPFLRRFAKLFICIGQLYALAIGVLLTVFGVMVATSDTSIFSLFGFAGAIIMVIGGLILHILYRLNRRGSRFRIFFSNKPSNPLVRWHVVCHENDEAVNALRIAEATHYTLIKKDTVKRMLANLFNNVFVLTLGGLMIFEIYKLIDELGELTSANVSDRLIFEMPWKLLLAPFGIYLIGWSLVWLVGRVFGGPLAGFANKRISGGIRAVCFGQDGPTILRDVKEVPHKLAFERLPIDPETGAKMNTQVEVLRAAYFDENRDQISKLVIGQSLADLLQGLPIEGLDKAMLHTTYFDYSEIVAMIADVLHEPGEVIAP